MTQRSPECPKCSTAMEEGITLDRAQSGITARSAWADGTPERSIWTGLKLKGHVLLPITTWRCPKCGLLESYARDAQP